jgi:hypothetical protein
MDSSAGIVAIVEEGGVRDSRGGVRPFDFSPRCEVTRRVNYWGLSWSVQGRFFQKPHCRVFGVFALF